MQRHRQRTTSNRRRSKRKSSSSRQQKHVDTALTWPGHYDEDEDDELLGSGMKLEDLRLIGSLNKATINMVYQYVFDEGLELSLVPENEAAPFTSGPKVLELGLSGFTGRLIITQQTFKQYGMNSYVSHVEDKKDTSMVSSSSSESEGRQPLHRSASKSRPGYRQQDTVKRRGKDTAALTSQRKSGKADSSPKSKKGAPQSPPPDEIDVLAAVFASSKVSKQMHTNVGQTGVDSFSNSVEVVSVASSVSTRAGVRAESEDTMDQFASMFASQATMRADKEGDIDEGSMAGTSQGDSVANDQGLSGSQGTMGTTREAPRTAGDTLDETSASGAESGSDAHSNAADDNLSDFAAAFTALSGKSEADGGSIDDDDDKTSNKYSIASADVSQRSASSTEEHFADDAVSDFVSTFTALSGPPNVPEVTLGSIDEGSSAPSMRSADDSGKVSQAEKQPQREHPRDSLSQFEQVFGELNERAKPSKNDMIDEESTPSMANSSSLSSSSTSAAASDQSSNADVGKKPQEEPPDPITDFVNAFGALSAGPSRPDQTIDEDSPSSAASSSTTTAPQSSASLSSSEDPLTQFTKAYRADPAVPSGVGGPRSIQAPEAPSGKTSPDQIQGAQSKPPESKTPTGQTKKRASQKSKTRRASGAASGKPTISLEKKRKIREMFPNYPDVSTGSHGSLDPVGVYLHQKCSAPFDKTLTPKDLRELLEVFPFAAYCADDKGRLPLHVLGENGRLVRDPQGRQRATALARLLIQAYPQSVTYPDSDGRLPFVALLHQWIEFHYEQLSGRYSKDQAKQSSRKSLATLQAKPGLLGQEERPIQYDRLFPNIELWPYAEWCLSMLSMILDDMIGKGILEEAIANRPIREQMGARRQYVGNVLQSLPYLMKSVLFLDGGAGSARNRILQTSFIRRALLSRKSVGKWLEAMVLKQGVPAKLAIDYFQLLSQTTPADYVGPKRAPDDNDVAAFNRERAAVYGEIEKMEVIKMEVIVPSLAVLDGKEAER